MCYYRRQNVEVRKGIDGYLRNLMFVHISSG